MLIHVTGCNGEMHAYGQRWKSIASSRGKSSLVAEKPRCIHILTINITWHDDAWKASEESKEDHMVGLQGMVFSECL